MDSVLIERLVFKINDIEKLFLEYELIFEKIKVQPPDLFDITILGSVLHSFYNGIENMFEIIGKNVDKELPQGNKSHQELLHQMASENQYRKEVISEELYIKLREYATFRHFYRHAYSFQLNWDKMKPLVDNLFEVWRGTKNSIEYFIKNN